MEIQLTMDAVVAAVVVRAVCAVLRVSITERGATERRRIEAGERLAVASLRAATAGDPRHPGPALAVSRAVDHSRATPCTRPPRTRSA